MAEEQKQVKFLRCIGEPTRLQILKLLAEGEKCVGDIVQGVGKEQSLISHHLQALKACNIVLARHDAQKIYYRLTDPRVAEIVTQCESLTHDLPLCQDD